MSGEMGGRNGTGGEGGGVGGAGGEMGGAGGGGDMSFSTAPIAENAGTSNRYLPLESTGERRQ